MDVEGAVKAGEQASCQLGEKFTHTACFPVMPLLSSYRMVMEGIISSLPSLLQVSNQPLSALSLTPALQPVCCLLCMRGMLNE